MPGIQGPEPITGQLAPTNSYQICAWCGGDINKGMLARTLIGEHGVHFYFHDPGLGNFVAVASIQSCWNKYLRSTLND